MSLENLKHFDSRQRSKFPHIHCEGAWNNVGNEFWNNNCSKKCDRTKQIQLTLLVFKPNRILGEVPNEVNNNTIDIQILEENMNGASEITRFLINPCFKPGLMYLVIFVTNCN